jgi:hypothetical protein
MDEQISSQLNDFKTDEKELRQYFANNRQMSSRGDSMQ